MSSKPIEGKYLLGARVEESFYMVQRALNELGLKKLKMKKEVRPSYLLVEYSTGWLEKTEIEFTLKGRQNATEISVKWFCPTSESEMRALTGDEGWLSLSRVDDENKRHQAERLLQELKSRIGATDIPPDGKASRDMV